MTSRDQAQHHDERSDPRTAQATSDGRRLRGEQSRQKIVAALISCIREGVVSPTAEQVADRAEVGLRSVFRHFQDMERLYREIALEVDALTLPYLQRRLKSSDWSGRILEMARIRCELFETLMPFQIATLVHRHESPFLETAQRQAARLQRDLLLHLLPRSVSRDGAWLDALDLTMSINSWLRLRGDQGLGPPQAQRAVLMAVKALTAVKAR